MEVVGTPSPEVLAKISSEHVSHQPGSSAAPALVLWGKGRVGSVGRSGIEPKAGAWPLQGKTSGHEAQGGQSSSAHRSALV